MKWSFSYCLLILLYSVDGKFRHDYTYYQEAEGWFKLHEVPATWSDAWYTCFREGAVLASPENPNFLSVMKTLAGQHGKSCGVFTGVHSTFAKGHYYSVDGTHLSKMDISWAPDEPDNFENGEECLIMLANGTMADVSCTNVYPYLCYKKKTPNMFTNGCGTIDTEYTFDARSGSCYKFHRLPQTWHRAFATCSGEGGHLVIINSDIEALVIKDLYAKNPDTVLPGKFIKHTSHIGHLDWGERGLWLTIHGQTLTEAGYNKWSAGEPGNTTQNLIGQYCGSVVRTGTLNDVWCDLVTPFICEKVPNNLADDE